MYAGHIVETGPAQEVLANPQHPYTTGLLGAIPHRRTPRGQLAAIPGSVPHLIDPPDQCHFASRCQWAAKLAEDMFLSCTRSSQTGKSACFRFEESESLFCCQSGHAYSSRNQRRGEAMTTASSSSSLHTVDTDSVVTLNDVKVHYPVKEGALQRVTGHVKAR